MVFVSKENNAFPGFPPLSPAYPCKQPKPKQARYPMLPALLLRNADFSDLANRTACSVLILNNDKLSVFFNIQGNIFF